MTIWIVISLVSIAAALLILAQWHSNRYKGRFDNSYRPKPRQRPPTPAPTQVEPTEPPSTAPARQATRFTPLRQEIWMHGSPAPPSGNIPSAVGASRQPGPCTLEIAYVDADGVYTTRSIAPYKTGHTNQSMEAWCSLRQARRTFYFERIQAARLLPTGTPLSRAGVFKFVHPDRNVPADLQS